MEPAPAETVAAPQPVAAAPQPKPQHAPQQHQTPRPDHRQKHQQHNKPQQQHHQPKPQQPSEPKKPDAHQLPAFLLRPVNVPKLAEKPAPRPKKKLDADV
jgi:hypothetical protein